MRGAFGLVRPSGALRVNWAHPAARGLRHLFLCDGSGALDLVTGLRWAATNGGAGIGPWGIGWRSTGSGSQINGPSGADAQFVGDQTVREITAIVGGRFSTSGFVSTALSNNTFGASGGWGLKAEQYDNTGNIGLTLPGVADYNSGIATPENDAVISAVIQNGNTNFQVGFSSTATVANAAPTGVGDNIVIGAQTRNAAYQDPMNSGDIVYWAAIIARALSRADQRVWHIAPFGTVIIRSSLFVVLANVGASSGAMTGTASLGFGAGATSLAGIGALTGGCALSLSGTPILRGSGTLAGACAFSFGANAALIGVGALSGSATMQFGGIPAMGGSGALVGAASIVFGGTPTLIGGGTLAGACALSISASGLLDLPSGSLLGTAALTFGGTPVIAGGGRLAGSAALTFSQIASVGGIGALMGACALSITASGSLDAPSGSMAGASSIAFTPTAVFGAIGQMAGIAAMTLTASILNGVSLAPSSRTVRLRAFSTTARLWPTSTTIRLL